MEWSEVIYEKVKKPILNLCVSLELTPNQLTIFNHILTLTVGCWGFSRGDYWFGILGLVIMLLNGMLDYLDGDLAEATGLKSKLGAWLDSGFDVIIQNAVMGAVAIGCVKMGMPVFWIVLFFIGNSGNNLVSFRYNEDFGFNSASGNALFRLMMEKRPTLINRIFKNMIDPTASFTGLIFFTYRYFLVIGILTGSMPLFFIFMTLISNVKWFMMFTLYALHQSGAKFLYVLWAIAVLDEERDEFYRVRYSGKV